MASGRCCRCNGPNAKCWAVPVFRMASIVYLVTQGSGALVTTALRCLWWRTLSLRLLLLHMPETFLSLVLRLGLQLVPRRQMFCFPVSIRAVPPLSEIFHSRITTLFHIPKSARDSWSEVLSFALRAASDCPNDLEAWVRLLMLPKCILFLPPFKARKEARFLAPNNKDWLKAWREGSYQDLLFEACKRSAHSHMPQSSSYNVRHACGAAQNVHFQKALRALGSFGLAPPDSGSFAAMLSKHPQCSPPQFSSSLIHPLPSHPSPPCSPPLFDSPPTVPPLSHSPSHLPSPILPHPSTPPPQPPHSFSPAPPLPSFPLSPGPPSIPLSSYFSFPCSPSPHPSHFPLLLAPFPSHPPTFSSISISVSTVCRSVLWILLLVLLVFAPLTLKRVFVVLLRLLLIAVYTVLLSLPPS